MFVPPSPGDLELWSSNVLTNFDTDVWSAASGLKTFNAPEFTLFQCNSIAYVNGVAQTSGRGSITPVVGTGTTRCHGGSSMVCTLRTNRAGRQHRGRIYIPMTGVALQSSTLQLSAAQVQGLVAKLKTWFDHVNALSTGIETSLTHRVIVGSKTNTGLSDSVTSLRVDTVVDMQRNRTDKFLAAGLGTANLA